MLTDKFSRWFMRSVPNFGLDFSSEMPVALGTDIGLAREENQDRLAMLRVSANSSASSSFVAVALADGMGGMLDGSECAARTLGAFFNALIRNRQRPPEERLVLASDAANEAVHQYSNGNGGATLSVFLFDADNRAFTVNVGDSRIYATKEKGLEEGVIRLTVDDSLEEAVGGHGTELLQFIGMGEGLVPHVSVVPKGVDKIVITSDGVHFVSHSLLSDILVHTDNQRKTVEELLTVAKWRGGPDNASVAAVLMEELLKSLTLSHESGIELRDPFGTLHVMWVKPEHQDTKEPVVVPADPSESSEHPLDKPARKPTQRRRAASKKPRKSKKDTAKNKPTQSNLDEDPQMSIDVGPIVNPSTKEGTDSDNS